MKKQMLVEEQWDEEGDMIFAINLNLVTHDRNVLDRLAEITGMELRFYGESR